MTKPVAVDRRRARHAKHYRVRIRLVAAPKGHDFDSAFDLLADMGREARARRAVAAMTEGSAS